MSAEVNSVLTDMVDLGSDSSSFSHLEQFIDWLQSMDHTLPSSVGQKGRTVPLPCDLQHFTGNLSSKADAPVLGELSGKEPFYVYSSKSHTWVQWEVALGQCQIPCSPHYQPTPPITKNFSWTSFSCQVLSYDEVSSKRLLDLYKNRPLVGVSHLTITKHILSH